MGSAFKALWNGRKAIALAVGVGGLVGYLFKAGIKIGQAEGREEGFDKGFQAGLEKGVNIDHHAGANKEYPIIEMERVN